ncbi:uncharacterized protein TNCV_6361 [Trichonephila clavipes]|nr:uncharacterized protein TNCV_6361 [Trichonephila clavipes]
MSFCLRQPFPSDSAKNWTKKLHEKFTCDTALRVLNPADYFLRLSEGYGNPVVKVSDHGRHVMSSSPVPLKTCRVGQRCTLNVSRAETSSRWCGVVVRREGASSGVIHVT